MLKKITYIFQVFILLLILCACGNSLPSIRQVKKDINQQYITKQNGAHLQIQKLIKFKPKSKKSDVGGSNLGIIHGNIHFIDDTAGADVTAPVDVIYVYVKEKGWIFSQVAFSNEAENKYIPLRHFTPEDISKALNTVLLGYSITPDKQLIQGKTYGKTIDGFMNSDSITSAQVLNSVYNKDDNSYTVRAQITSATPCMNLVGIYTGKIYHGFPGYYYLNPFTPLEQYPIYKLPIKLTGSYDINSDKYPVDFTYTIEVNETEGEYRTGTLNFIINDNYNEPIKGSYSIKLQYNEMIGNIKITAGSWITHPKDTERFNMELQYNGPQDFFEGKVYNAADNVVCGTCFVDKINADTNNLN